MGTLLEKNAEKKYSPKIMENDRSSGQKSKYLVKNKFLVQK